MDPAEVEFLAEKEFITVVPNFALDKIFLIGGDIGPFTAGLPIEVPLWMAINLKQRQKARIRPPEWMDRILIFRTKKEDFEDIIKLNEEEKLQEKKQEETDSKFFTEMPCKHYMELTQLLLKYAMDDIPHADETRTLIKDIWDLRISKLRSSIDTFVKSDATHAKLNHLTLMELNSVRPFLTKSLDHLHMLRTNITGGVQLTQD